MPARKSIEKQAQGTASYRADQQIDSAVPIEIGRYNRSGVRIDIGRRCEGCVQEWTIWHIQVETVAFKGTQIFSFRRHRERIGDPKLARLLVERTQLGQLPRPVQGPCHDGPPQARSTVWFLTIERNKSSGCIQIEPTIGIDPIQVVETRSLIQDLGKAQTVVLSSHILPEVSMICGRVLIIHEGRIVAEDTPSNLAQRFEGVDRLEVEVGGPVAQVLPILKGIAGVNDVAHVNNNGRHTYTIQAEAGKDLRNEISRAVISNGWSLQGLQLVGMSLEEIFLRLTTHEEL